MRYRAEVVRNVSAMKLCSLQLHIHTGSTYRVVNLLIHYCMAGKIMTAISLNEASGFKLTL